MVSVLQHSSISSRVVVGLTELDNCTAQYRTNKAPVDGVWPRSWWILPNLELVAHTSMKAYGTLLEIGQTNRLGIMTLQRKKYCLPFPKPSHCSVLND